MKGKQLAMDAALADLDRYELEREKRETDAIKAKLDERYERVDCQKLKNKEYPEGSVFIIGQHIFRNGHYILHFYRTVMTYHPKGLDCCRAFFVESRNEEFPERPPWADTVGHEGDPRDIDYYPEHIHWFTGEVVEPVETWIMKENRKWWEAKYDTKTQTAEADTAAGACNLL